MKKYIFTILIILILPHNSYCNYEFSFPENKLLNGPIMQGAKICITYKNSIFIFKADMLSFEKQKIGFLKTSLVKNLTAQNILVEFKKNKKTELLFTAEKALFSAGRNKISIKKPQIIYPENLKQTDKIYILLKKKISLIYKNQTTSYYF